MNENVNAVKISLDNEGYVTGIIVSVRSGKIDRFFKSDNVKRGGYYIIDRTQWIDEMIKPTADYGIEVTQEEFLKFFKLMSEIYYLMAENGYKPKYKHESLESAITEAKRLITQMPHLGKIEVLKSLGHVQYKEVPVTERKIVVDVNQSELPF